MGGELPGVFRMGVPSINARLALPGRKARVVWVTGDATPLRIGAVDWTNRTVMVEEVKALIGLVRALMAQAENHSALSTGPEQGPTRWGSPSLRVAPSNGRGQRPSKRNRRR